LTYLNKNCRLFVTLSISILTKAFVQMKEKVVKAIKEAAGIFIIAITLGLAINIIHPKGVKISIKRPSLKFAPDTVLAQDLPGVSVMIDGAKTIKNKIETAEPLLITTTQVVQLKENDLAIMLDARTRAEFLTSHIPGAQNIPGENLADYRTKIDSLPQDKWLICYCDGPPCDQAELLADELIIAGYELVAVYFDGLNGWKNSGKVIRGREAGS